MKKYSAVVTTLILLFGICAFLSISTDNVAASWIDVYFAPDESVVYKGETYTITWDSYDAGDYVDIELYTWWDSYYSTIYSYAINDGSYYWTIPTDLPVGSSYYVRITSSSYSDVYGYCDSYFYVYEPERSISVNSPYSGDTWYFGEIYTITWDSELAGDYVDIELLINGVFDSIIAYDASNIGYYYWTIPSTLIESSSYQIKIQSTSYMSAYGYSGYFTIEDWYYSGDDYYSNSDSNDDDVTICIVGLLAAVVVVIVIIQINKRKKEEQRKKAKETKKREEEQRIKEREKKRIDELKDKIRKMKDEGYNVDELEKELDSYKKT